MKAFFGKIILIFISFSLCFYLFNFRILSGQTGEKIKISYIDNSFENASPLNWEIQGDTAVKIFLFADYERESLNRQTDHWYFKVEADKGTRMKIILSKFLPDVYNGKKAVSWWSFKNVISCYISYDGKNWEAVGTKKLSGFELMTEFTMKENSVFVVRMPPYTISDLESLKKRVSTSNLVSIVNIGKTIEQRPLEIIQLGKLNAPNHIIIRARAHPWEAGGNWVTEGLINEFISRNNRSWQETFCVHIMPMANKDGVARGMTRFNLKGKDLNRNWDKMSDPELCPEKYAFERYIQGLAEKGIIPVLGIDFHNDDYGGINLAGHPKNDLRFIENMKLFEKLMRDHTSFSEQVKYSWISPGEKPSFVLFQDGLLQRFGIEGMVFELNANWIGSLNKMPSEYDWMEFGKNLNQVFYEYLKAKH